MEELSNLVACPLEVAKFVNSLFVHHNLDVLFLRGIRTMFIRNHYARSLRLVEEATEVRNPKGTYLFCMLELLRGTDLGPKDLKWVCRHLGSMKKNEDMGWLRDHVVRQFLHEISDDWVLHVTADSWLRCHGK